MQKQTLAIFIIAIILSLGIGIFAGTKISKKAVPQGVSPTADNTYQSGWDAAMKTLKDSGTVAQFPEGMEIKNLNGTIQSISGNTVTLKVTTPGFISTPALSVRTVTVNTDTKIVKLIQKDQARLQKEFDDFNAQMKQQGAGEINNVAKNTPMPPAFQDTQDATLSDLKVDQMIMVQAAGDIKDAQAFVATEIQIQQAMVVPAAMPQPPVTQ